VFRLRIESIVAGQERGISLERCIPGWVQDVVVQSRWVFGRWVMALMTEERGFRRGLPRLDFPALEGFAQNTSWSDVYHDSLFSRVGLKEKMKL
jgi:hypothetical protein